MPTVINSEGKERTGVFTSGIVSTGQDHRIAMFFTGQRHAGENLEAVLNHQVSWIALSQA